MVKAKAIVCTSNDEDERLAIHYLFSSDAAAHEWLDSADDPMYRLGSAAYGWKLINRTLAGRVTLTARHWQQVVRQVGGSRD